MGIRIKKCLGYAIENIKFSKKSWQYTDDRINPLGWLGTDTDYEDRENIWTLDGYLTYCKHHLDKFNYNCEKYYFNKTKNPNAKYWDPYNYIIEDPEYGIPGVILFQPATSSSWYRSDNIIDYYEHELHCDRMENNIKFLNTPIFPYIGYMNSKTGISLDVRFADEFWYTIKTKQTDKKWQIYAEFNAKKLGFNSIDEAKLHIIPKIPSDLIALIRYLCIFTDDNTIWQLRPAIYTFWS